MHSIFAGSLNLSQVKDLGTQIHTIQFYILEIYPVLHIGGGYTLSYYIAEVYAALVLCWAILNIIILLR